MSKLNAYIAKSVEQEIQRRIDKGQLYTPEMVDAIVNAAVLADHEVWTKMMTIAVNRGAGIGKKRFRENIQPELDGLLDDLERREKEDGGDQTHALSVIDRMYDQIMED